MHRANGLVVGVKEEGVLLVMPAVAGCAWFENELLIEPCGMSQVPFQRADIRHRLDDKVFRLKVITQSFADRSRINKTLEQTGAISGCCRVLRGEMLR